MTRQWLRGGGLPQWLMDLVHCWVLPPRSPIVFVIALIALVPFAHLRGPSVQAIIH